MNLCIFLSFSANICMDNTNTSQNNNIKIQGEFVPEVVVTLDAFTDAIYFEHHILLWKDPSVNIAAKILKGLGRRFIAGLPIVMTEAHGSGKIAFSRDGVGQIISLQIKPGTEIDVREHQFLLATKNVDYSFTRVKGISNILIGGTGFFMDRFTGSDTEGTLLLHGYGNVFERNLEANESIDIEPGAFLYKDSTVNMTSTFTALSTGFFASTNLVLNRFTGPGRIGYQTMSVYVSTDSK